MDKDSNGLKLLAAVVKYETYKHKSRVGVNVDRQCNYVREAGGFGVISSLTGVLRMIPC